MYNIEKVWKDWKIVRLIGEGSFGKVYEIVRNHGGVEEHSAMKVVQIPNSTAELQSLKNDGMDDNSLNKYYISLVKDFSQEISVMVKLRGNPGIVACEDYHVIRHENELGWDIIIRMELLTPLSKITSARELTRDEVIDLGISLCDALEVCYNNKIIHRDIKIDNIFVANNGQYKLGDFGVARTIEKTAAGLSKKGTYTYMAPEVYKGEPYGHRADIYSLGMVMYRLLNHNREPFLPPPPAGITYTDKNNALIRRMRGEGFNPPAMAGGALGRVILKACEYNAQNRFRSAAEMKQALLKIKANPNADTEEVLPQKNNDKSAVTIDAGMGYDYLGRQQYDPNRFYIQNQNNYYIRPQKPHNSAFSTVAVLLGWLGILIEFLGIFLTGAFEWVKPVGLLVIIIVSMLVTLFMMVFFSFKVYSRVTWTAMIISSVLSLSIINIIAAFMFYPSVFFDTRKF